MPSRTLQNTATDGHWGNDYSSSTTTSTSTSTVQVCEEFARRGTAVSNRSPPHDTSTAGGGANVGRRGCIENILHPPDTYDSCRYIISDRGNERTPAVPRTYSGSRTCIRVYASRRSNFLVGTLWIGSNTHRNGWGYCCTRSSIHI